MIKLLVLDADGCLTNGQITYTSSGDELKSFSVKDGLGIDTWIKMGRKVAIITGRSSGVLERRAEELKVNYLYQGIKDKRGVLSEIMEIERLGSEEIAVMGDDLNDYKMLALTENSYCPSDAGEQIKGVVSNVMTKRGGEGAVREMIEEILKKEGKIAEFTQVWG